jgi:N4-gp56 family major capsid protein
MAGLITTSIRRKFVPLLRNKLRFAPYAAEGKLEVRGGTKTLRWNFLADIGTFTTTLGETTTSQNEVATITVSSVLMTVADYGAFIKISDLADSVWSSETRKEFADIFSYSAAKTMDTLLRNVADDTTNYLVSGESAVNTGTLATTDTARASDLNAIRGFFDQNDNDSFDSLGGNYLLVVHGEVEQDMVGDVTTTRLSWSPLIQNVPAGVDRITNYKGPGTLLGIAVMRSNNLNQAVLTASMTPASDTLTVTAYQCIALAENGIGKTTLDQAEPRIIMKRPGSATVSVPLDTYGTLGWKLRSAQNLLHSTRALVYYAAK